MSTWAIIGDLITHPGEALNVFMYGVISASTEQRLQDELATAMRKAGATDAQIEAAQQKLHAQIIAQNAENAAASPVPGTTPTQFFWGLSALAVLTLAIVAGFFIWKATK